MTSAQGFNSQKLCCTCCGVGDTQRVPASQQGFASYMAGTDNPPEYNGYLCVLYKSHF